MLVHWQSSRQQTGREQKVGHSEATSVARQEAEDTSHSCAISCRQQIGWATFIVDCPASKLIRNDEDEFVGPLLVVPATCSCISGTDLLRQLYGLPHRDRGCRVHLLFHLITVYRYLANQCNHWPPQQALGSVAVRPPIFKSLVWLDRRKVVGHLLVSGSRGGHATNQPPRRSLKTSYSYTVQTTDWWSPTSWGRVLRRRGDGKDGGPIPWGQEADVGHDTEETSDTLAGPLLSGCTRQKAQHTCQICHPTYLSGTLHAMTITYI